MIAGFIISINPGFMFMAISLYIGFVIYLIVNVSLFSAGIVLEDLDITESIKRSFFLVKDYWWFTLGVLFVALLLALFGQYALMTISSIFTYVSVSDMATAPLETSKILTIIMAIFLSFSYLLYIIPNTAAAFHFFSQIEKKNNNLM